MDQILCRLNVISTYMYMYCQIEILYIFYLEGPGRRVGGWEGGGLSLFLGYREFVEDRSLYKESDIYCIRIVINLYCIRNVPKIYNPPPPIMVTER